MKYIRTIDGAILKGNDYGFGVGAPYENYDVKIADAIEELFDEYIVDANYKEKPYLYDRNEPVDSPEFDSEDEVVYGAIWIRGEYGEPILKPVAKLKKKGGWKLL